MTRPVLFYMLAIALAEVVVSPSLSANDQLPAVQAVPKSAASRLAEQLMVRMAGLSVQQYVEGQLDTMLEDDAVAAQLLPSGSPARVAFLKAAILRVQRRIEPTIKSVTLQLSAALSANLTPAQTDITLRAFGTPTGKRVIDRVVSEMMLSDGDEMGEISDEEARSLVDSADIAALVAFQNSGAEKALNRALSSMPERDNDMTGEMNAILLAMIKILKTPQGSAVATDPAGPVI